MLVIYILIACLASPSFSFKTNLLDVPTYNNTELNEISSAKNLTISVNNNVDEEAKNGTILTGCDCSKCAKNESIDGKRVPANCPTPRPQVCPTSAPCPPPPVCERILHCISPYTKVGNKCLFVGQTALTFSKSMLYCNNLNAELASISNPELLEEILFYFKYIQDVFSPVTLKYYWVGGYYNHVFGKWEWLNRQNMTLSSESWESGRPGSHHIERDRYGNIRNQNKNRNCAAVKTGDIFKLTDHNCEGINVPICLRDTQFIN